MCRHDHQRLLPVICQERGNFVGAPKSLEISWRPQYLASVLTRTPTPIPQTWHPGPYGPYINTGWTTAGATNELPNRQHETGYAQTFPKKNRKLCHATKTNSLAYNPTKLNVAERTRKRNCLFHCSENYLPIFADLLPVFVFFPSIDTCVPRICGFSKYW